MANFAVNNSLGGTQQSVTTTFKTLVVTYGGATAHRGKVYDILVGTNGTPADNYMTWDMSAFTSTAILTATTIVPVPLDQADAAALMGAYANATTELTYTTNSSRFNVGVNQRASYRWVAAPGSEIVYPATTLNGMGLRVLSGGYTGTATGHFLVQEQ